MRNYRPLALGASSLLFMACLFFTAFFTGDEYESVSSFSLLIFGWIGLAYGYWSWLANPAYFIAIATLSKPYLSAFFSILAFGLSLLFLLQEQMVTSEAPSYAPIVGLGVGYKLWVGSFGVLAIWNVIRAKQVPVVQEINGENMAKRFEKDFKSLTPEEIAQIPLSELQRIRNKRWAFGKKELLAQVEEELARRDPRPSWACTRCESTMFHEKQIRVAGGLTSALIGVETEKFHAVVCNYCGKTEFYCVLLDGSSKALDFLVG
ncbi:MAG: zinc ribbon domain-containing protein [Oceanococcus sp.]